jgi:acyl-CoA synthetase (AMP-forming)/AMP-acid ligase II
MFEAQVRLIRDQYGIKPGEIDLPMLPIFALFNPALGMTTVVPEMDPSRPAAVDPKKIVRAIIDHNVTSSFGSPVLWGKIGSYCKSAGIQLPTIKRILIAGAPVTPGTLRVLEDVVPNGEIHTPYGATEALPVSTISKSEILKKTWKQTQSGSGTCVGRVFNEVCVSIIPETLEVVESLTDEVGVRQIGEIIVRGPTVTREYFNNPEATRFAKIYDGAQLWHRMGDLGYVDEDGRLWFCGRKAECVRTDSGVFYTDCCEGVFNAIDGISRTALIGLKKREKLIPAIVVEPLVWPLSRDAKKRLLQVLHARAREHVHTYAIETFFFQKKFPVDVRHNAKIHRLALARKWSRKGS